jgi:N-dimethylarginine dimethylaminohydrolase
MQKPTILMGTPENFRVKSGSNPHTRTRWGLRKKVNSPKAARQWHSLAKKLTGLGVQVLVLPPVEEWPGTVYPANAGFLWDKTFYLSNLIPGREGEREYYQNFIQRIGFIVAAVPRRFEGEADFFPTGEGYLLTHGVLKDQRFVFRWGFPPWKRVYGFRSDQRNLEFLQSLATPRKVISIELTDEAYYHGDTVLCSFGLGKKFLLAYLSKISKVGAQQLQAVFKEDLIPLRDEDGKKFAANSFYAETEKGKFLITPEGFSRELMNQIEKRGVTPIPVDVSEFFSKGGGSVKCMVCDLGIMDMDDPNQTEEVKRFRKERLY